MRNAQPSFPWLLADSSAGSVASGLLDVFTSRPLMRIRKGKAVTRSPRAVTWRPRSRQWAGPVRSRLLARRRGACSSGPALRGAGAGPAGGCPLPSWRLGRRVPLAGSAGSGAAHFGSGVTVSSPPPSSFSSRRYCRYRCRRRQNTRSRAAGAEPASAVPSSSGWGRRLAPDPRGGPPLLPSRGRAAQGATS